MIEETKARLGDFDCLAIFQLAEAESLPYPEQCFDAVVANHMLYHVPNLDNALSEIKRVLKRDGRLYASTNGKGHLRELHDMVLGIAPSMGRLHDTIAEHFGLENGTDLLSNHFSCVELRRYEGDLEVTDPQAVTDYVLSFPDTESIFTGDAIDRIRSAVRNEIRRRGSMQIKRDVGLFIAY